MTATHDVNVIAHYFPQFHAIPENDKWWGKGFTDWVNVKKAKPHYREHFQPRIPLDNRYYDQSQIETLAWQIDLAKRHNISGFCHYHYWFDGKQLLNTPTDLVMANRELDLPFCLAWANETWSRRWDGQDHHILQEQTHIPEKSRWAAHFEYLFRAWSDDRAIKVDGKPIFLIYRAHRITQIREMFDYWRELAHQRGLPGIYLVSMKQYEFPVPEIIPLFDATVQFQPFEAIYSPDYVGDKGLEQSRWLQPLRLLPEPMIEWLRTLRGNVLASLTFYDYETVWQQILKVEREAGIPCFPGAFVDWDNTARYGKRARIFKGASPERFAHYFKQLVKVTSARPAPEQLIFVNAWNEWAEGTYLEPDTKFGCQYIEAVRDAIAEHRVAIATTR
jgi:lipopolysaccharide biosynthesis protein